MSSYPLFFTAALEVASGNWEKAGELLEASRQDAQSGNLHALRWTEAIHAELDLLAGRSQTAISRLVPLVERASTQEAEVNLMLTRLAWAYLEGGAVERAEAMASSAVRRCQRLGYRLLLVDALWVQGMVWRRVGRFAQAKKVLVSCSSRARRLPYPYAEARALLELGSLSGDVGESEKAREAMEKALVIFRRLRAEPSVAWTVRVLTELG
jgi:tetratricopeptide (TPR) repeat protein